MNWAETYMMQAAGVGTSDPIYDCWHFIALIQREVFNIHIPDFAREHTKDLPEFIATQTQSEWQQVDETDIREGDLCLTNIQRTTPHIGVITPDGHMLHFSRGVAKTERLDSLAWRRRKREFYRYCGV